MNTKMKNLFNREEWIVLNLNNCKHQTKIYIEQLNQLVQKHDLTIEEEQKAQRFKRYFDYYQEHLIPALEELAAMEVKHIEIYDKNPDPHFKPVELAIKQQTTLMNKFVNRFRELHVEFYDFLKAVKNNAVKAK